MADDRWPHDAATARPWAWQSTGEKDNSWAIGVVADEDGKPIAGEVEPGEGEVVDGVAFSGMAENLADAALIVEAVNNYDHPLCPAGCGCHLWTEDADRNDCGCDGPCCWYDWDQFMEDVLDRPDYYRELREARGVAPSGVGGTDG